MVAVTDDTCPLPSCGRLWDLHTLREFREHHPTRSLNLAYEDAPEPTMVPGIPGTAAGAVVTRAAVVDGGPGLGFVPVLLFRFVHPNGLDTAVETFMALTDLEMLKLGRMLDETAKGAVRAAKAARQRGSLGA